jgi:hypothetical protein
MKGRVLEGICLQKGKYKTTKNQLPHARSEAGPPLHQEMIGTACAKVSSDQ